MADKTSKKVQARYKKDYGRQVLFEQPFAAGDNVLLERPPVMASATEHIAYERYYRHLHRSTTPYPVISAGPEYKKLDQDGIRNLYQSTD